MFYVLLFCVFQEENVSLSLTGGCFSFVLYHSESRQKSLTKHAHMVCLLLVVVFLSVLCMCIAASVNFVVAK